ncbi:hypothetical protein [Campylobacter sp. CCUG 57310]|uniref:hypothetical protein n=1 Tax=Campylobacter sp. CCUG 57310 TaxID=2517362 RepID=UPI001563AD77|nr:hypothetical protein [Campylobacter sp. CCUG 57310]QKF92751.1 outer membrane lipoprotein [Campylobacter sp. CCUG 57310]
MKFKTIFLMIAAAFLFLGCSSKTSDGAVVTGNFSSSSSSDAKFHFEEVMKIPIDCSSCKGSGNTVTINGTKYRSDVAIKCCLKKNMIDTKTALKKVYIHRITDEREDAQSIKYIRQNGSTVVFNSNPRLEPLFYMFLKQELLSRGILVVENQTSPYTYRLDFSFTELKGVYSRSQEQLNSQLFGVLKIKNINYGRILNITTKQEVKKLAVSRTGQFDIYVSLLVKQAANKVAEEISKL